MADLGRVKVFLRNHPHLELIKDSNDRNKVRCKLTNHELPCSMSAIESYTEGKKYQRLSKASHEYEKYKEFLVPHKTKRNQLFCQLTKKSINNIPHHIKQHVTGKRFTKALEQSKASENQKGGDIEMWVPSDLESDSELEEVGDDTGSEEENEEVKMSSDENEEAVVEESVENNSSKAHPSKPAKRKSKQEQKRQIEENSEEITSRKKAKKEKSKHSSTNSQRTISETKERNRKTPQPKETMKKSGKPKVVKC